MDTTSTPVKKKPKTPPKPILEPHISSFSGNKDVNPLESTTSPTKHSESLTENSNNGKSFQVLGQKPPLLPKPKNLKKATFSSPHRHHDKILTNTNVSVNSNSNVCSVIDYSYKSVNSTVTEVTSFNIESNRSDVHDSITCLKTGFESIQYEKDNNRRTDVIFHPDRLVNESDDCKNMYTASIIDELNPNTSESQILSLTENFKEFSNERNDNIEEVQTDVERIVANTWAALQEDSITFPKTVNIKFNNHGNLSLNSSDISNKNANNNNLILNKTTTCPSLSQVSNYDEEKSGINKTHSLNSISELVRTLHTVKVESSDASDKISDRKDSGNESFLHRTKINTKENASKNEAGNNSFIQHQDTSISKLAVECSGYEIDYNLDTETNKHDKLEKHNRSASWSDDTGSALSRSNSVGSGSYDGPNTVRRRFSTWLGSFGKGNKQKETRESCLFYYDHSEADDSTVKQNEEISVSQSSLNETSSSLNQSNKLNLLKVPQYSSSNFDDDSNRSSVSDESFDVKHLPKLQSENKSSNSVQITVQDMVEKKKQKCYFIAKELVSSEKVFIDVLQLLCVDFKTFVEEIDVAQKSSVIPMNDFNRIINTLPLLLDFNKDLLRDFQSRIDSWSDLPKIADVIVKKGPFLKLYITYIRNFQIQTDYLDECCQKYPRFAKAVKDFEASDRCKKLALKHYMLKPIQRIPQYRLLLEDYLDHQEEGSVDYADTRAALEIVHGVALAANKSIAQGDNLSKLLSLQSQLGNYEIIKPGREFVMEGELYKLSRKEMQLRFFILLSDCLLYTSYYGSMTGLRVKNKLPLSGMKVNPAHDKDSPTEFSIITSTRSFTLRAKSEEECEAWLNALQNAIQENNSKQMTFLNMNFIPMNAADEPLKLGRELEMLCQENTASPKYNWDLVGFAPVWIPDKRVTMCQVCTSEFTVTFRRHHCRACGKVVCGSCSDYKAPLQYKEFQPCRVCEDCFEFLLKEIDDNSANMLDLIKNEFKIEEDSALTNMVEQIRSSFKKPGPSSGKKVRKYIPQRLKEVTANDSGSRMSGWLFYRRSRRSWKRLWFVLKEQVLYVYKASEDVVALETIPVLGYAVDMFKEGEYEESIGDCRFVFQLTHAGQFPFVFSTDTQQSAERWISAIREATLLK